MVDHQHNDCSDYGDNHAVKIEAGDPACTECVEDEASDNRACNTENNVDEKALPRFVTILLAMKPAMRPRTIHPIIDIIHLACLEPLPGRGRAVYHRFALGCSGQYLDDVGTRPEAADEGRTFMRETGFRQCRSASREA